MLEFFLSDHRALVQDGIAIVLIVIAFVWGGGPERVFALAWLFLFEITRLAHSPFVQRSPVFDTIDPFLATVDLVALVIFTLCALYANRNYMLWIAGMQVLAMTAHLARGMVEEISQISYAMMAYMPGWFQLLFFAIGLSRHVMRRRQYGYYRDWRTSGAWPRIVLPPEKKWPLLGLLGHDFFPVREKR